MPMVKCNFLVELNWVFAVGLISIVDYAILLHTGSKSKETISIYAQINIFISANKASKQQTTFSTYSFISIKFAFQNWAAFLYDCRLFIAIYTLSEL